MKKCIATLVLLACTGFAAAATGTEPTPSIAITGTGKVTYVPDLGYIHVGVASEGVTAAEAWKKNEAIVKKIFAALHDLGLEERDFKTTNLNVQPRYLYKKDEAPKFLGYTVTYDLVVTVRKLDQMGALLDRMVGAGANRNMSVSFGCSNLDELVDEARARAVADALQTGQPVRHRRQLQRPARRCPRHLGYAELPARPSVPDRRGGACGKAR